MKKKFWRSATSITESLLALSIGVLCESWKKSIDQNLGTVSSEFQTSDKTIADTYSFVSDYATSDELVQAHRDLNEQIQEEGSAITLLGINSHYPYYGGQMGAVSTRPTWFLWRQLWPTVVSN